jgi:hypothetical protein
MAPQPVAVATLLRTIRQEDAEDHHLEAYAEAMEGFGRMVTSVLGIGADTISLILDDGNVLKIGTRTLEPEMGNRAFDLPILLRGIRKLRYWDHDYLYRYFIQPMAEEITEAQYRAFVKEVYGHGYWFSDPRQRNVGYYRAENRVALIDPWAVEKLRLK